MSDLIEKTLQEALVAYNLEHNDPADRDPNPSDDPDDIEEIYEVSPDEMARARTLLLDLEQRGRLPQFHLRFHFNSGFEIRTFNMEIKSFGDSQWRVCDSRDPRYLIIFYECSSQQEALDHVFPPAN